MAKANEIAPVVTAIIFDRSISPPYYTFLILEGFAVDRSVSIIEVQMQLA
jgi:hypothetical protein